MSFALRVAGLIAAAALLSSAPVAAQSTIDTVAGGGQSTADVTTRSALLLDAPTAVAGDREGRLLVAASGRIWRLDGDTATRIAGDGTFDYSGDGGPARDARIGLVPGIAVDSAGNIFFADSNARRIRRIGTDGIVTTVEGDGKATTRVRTEDGGSTAISLGLIRGLAIDSRDRLLVAAGPYLYRFNTDGWVWSSVGNPSGCYTPDGALAFQGCFDSIIGVAVDNSDEAYFLDVNDVIWRVDHDERVRIMGRNKNEAGTGSTALAMSAIAVDEYGRLYATNRGGPRVHRFDVPWPGTSIAGTGVAGFGGDGGSPGAAQFDNPSGIAVIDNVLYVADTGNDRLRAFALDGRPTPSRPPIPEVVVSDVELLVWLRPSTRPGTAPVTGYTLRVVRADDPTVAVGVDVDAGTLEMGRVVTGLERHVAYMVQVVAHNAHGDSVPSAWVKTRSQLQPQVRIGLDPEQAEVAEGNAGITEHVITGTLTRTLPKDYTIEIVADPTLPTVEPGVDFDPTPMRITIPAGELEGTTALRIHGDTVYEYDELVRMRMTRIAGPTIAFTSHLDVWIRNDDPEPPDPIVPLVVDDRFELIENDPATPLAILANDTLDATLFVGGLVISEAPSRGTATIDTAGTATPVDDRIVYTPGPDRGGEDHFAYRLCYAQGCREAVATVLLRPFAPIAMTVGARSGYRDAPHVSARDRVATTYTATPMVAPIIVWNDIGEGYVIGDDGQPASVRLLAVAHSDDPEADFDLHIAIDRDGDFMRDADETVCTAAMGGQDATCEARVDYVGGNASTVWWTWVVRRNVAAPVTLDVYPVPLTPTDHSLVASAAPRVADGAVQTLRLSWLERHPLPGQKRAGFVRVAEAGGDESWVPVRIGFGTVTSTALALVPGEFQNVTVPMGTTENRVFVDVPAGATRLSVKITGDQGVPVYLVPAPAADPAVATIAPAPSLANAVASDASMQHERTLVVDAPQAGRWYLVVVTPAATEPWQTGKALGVVPTIEGVAPPVRPGSYFNAGRPGHGLFLYPAGGELAGLWYTYREDGTPTWYYLQGVQPGANGVWTAPIFRSAWLGDHNVLTPVGKAVLTPTGADAFALSTMIDGRAGSEPLAALGRGCPLLESLPVDASSHWFDPARAGTGYSVQLWPDYEFYAAFVYDERGEARFLTGESGTFAGADATIALEQLQGFCPTCAAVVPSRRTVGLLRRNFAAGALQRVRIDAMFDAPLAGDWVVDDTVQVLGGAGTTQGCTP